MDTVRVIRFLNKIKGFASRLGRGHSNIAKRCPGCASGDEKNHLSGMSHEEAKKYLPPDMKAVAEQYGI
mgnify:CR=1 FL=1